MGCILCFEEECKNGGMCMDANSTYACECPIGYAEEDCSRDIDWCEGDVHCQNGATCVDGIANFTCTCELGYAGLWNSSKMDYEGNWPLAPRSGQFFSL